MLNICFCIMSFVQKAVTAILQYSICLMADEYSLGMYDTVLLRLFAHLTLPQVPESLD